MTQRAKTKYIFEFKQNWENNFPILNESQIRERVKRKSFMIKIEKLIWKETKTSEEILFIIIHKNRYLDTLLNWKVMKKELVYVTHIWKIQNPIFPENAIIRVGMNGC